jgi:hypothetical protein
MALVKRDRPIADRFRVAATEGRTVSRESIGRAFSRPFRFPRGRAIATCVVAHVDTGRAPGLVRDYAAKRTGRNVDPEQTVTICA